MKDDKMKMTRRKFLQVSAAAGAVAAAGGLELAAQAAKESGQEESDLTYVRTTCAPNCTGACGQNACVLNRGKEDEEIKFIIQ